MSIREVEEKIETMTGKRVLNFESVNGGSIALSYIAHLSNKDKLFIKTYEAPEDFFQKEVNGLQELSQKGKVRTPEILFHDRNYLVMEYIEHNTMNDAFYDQFAETLAEMHRQESDSFGFREDNYIGATIQKNTPEIPFDNGQWADFFIQMRLDFQVGLAVEKNLLPEEQYQQYQQLKPAFYHLLEQVKERPSLLHGDLWSGNILAGNHGVSVFIDPAVFYGHRETDIAMTKLFGGFPNHFYETYHKCYPMQDGYQERENLYKLYHWFNHVNLFGKGYLVEVKTILDYYQKELK